MVVNKSPSTLVVGLAFFSMFFGSGNLIFPLLLGVDFGSHVLIGALGFIITAVLLPTLGILASLPTHGNYERLLSGILPEGLSRWFFLLVLIFWIPLGSGPRCVVLAHASVAEYLPAHFNVFVFSLIFLTIVYFSVVKRTRIIAILGKYLTPLLLISIAGIVVMSFTKGQIQAIEMNRSEVFFKSLIDGYYTQDLIAAIFFSSALFNMLHLGNETRKEALKKTLRGGLLAVFLLSILYTALMASSALHAEQLRGLSGEKLVSTLAHIALGTAFGGLSSVAVSLACLTTEIALVLVFADFLHKHMLHSKPYAHSLLITLVMIFAMAQLEFGGIMAIVAPAMQIIYPLLFILVVRFIWQSRNQLIE